MGSTVLVSCDTGYNIYPDSAAFRQCGSDKQWTGQDPTCKRNVTWVNFIWFGFHSTVAFCILCMVFGSTFANPILTIRFQEFLFPLYKVAVGLFLWLWLSVHSFTLSVAHTHLLALNESFNQPSIHPPFFSPVPWLLPFIHCCFFVLVVDCGDPGTPWHGYLSGAVFTYNSKVTFSCRAKHHLSGNTERLCQANGQWSGQQPRCLGTPPPHPLPFFWRHFR